jgi:predicted Zn-dependent peptidase
MAFKGTSHRNVDQIRDFTNRHFLSFNASTYTSNTEYYATVVHTKLNLACDFITDIYAHSNFPSSEIKKEKGPVLLEAARNIDSDSYFADMALCESLYKKNPLRQFSTGTEEGIRSISRNDLLREKAKWYVPSNTVAVAVGRVSHENFVREIDKRIPLNKTSVVQPIWDAELSSLPSVGHQIIERKDRKRTTILMGCKMPDKVSEHIETVEDFLITLLASGWSSRLWNEVRSKRGLAYSARGTIYRSYGLGAYFSAEAQTMPGKEGLVESLMRKAFFKPITKKDIKIFEATKENMLDRIIAGYGENLGSWNRLIYDRIAKGESVRSINRYFAEQRRIVNKLTINEAEKIRKELFRPERFATVIIKPKGK